MPLKPVISCRRVDQAKRIHQFLQSASKGGSALLDPPYNAYLQSNWPDCPSVTEPTWANISAIQLYVQ